MPRGRKPGSKDLKPRNTANWTQAKRQALSRKMRTMTDKQELHAVQRITTEGGPTITQLGKEIGVSRHVLVHALDCRIGAEARRKAVRARQSEDMRGNKRGVGRRFPTDIAKDWEQSRRGPGNPNWRGGSRRKREAIVSLRHLAEYKEFVETVLGRDLYRCTRCGKRSQLLVHHIVDEKEAPQLLMDMDNAETLCRACHMSEHIKRGDIPCRQDHHYNQET